ncbi:hypothetical protein Fluta_3827 [Fluviicola taffensis DSM 16823]|uniref:Uncharacterized protein n=1 Tax=Fluviicola taffensis (strain DSM 16823 / NCIMB 13979 / RW262) TaxID=755732 RepID=F2IGC7_FLUTR|nr:hypothetical protein Fluta_3827 [Fluviicola taffensis DSM 16823]
MNHFINEFMEFIFGKRLKLVLLLIGILSFVAYINNVMQFGYAIFAAGLIFSAVYLSVHEKR